MNHVQGSERAPACPLKGVYKNVLSLILFHGDTITADHDCSIVCGHNIFRSLEPLIGS